MVMKQRMLKKMLNLGLTLIFVLTAMLSLLPPDVAAARDAGYEPNSDVYEPIILTSVADDATVKAGQYTGVKLTLENLNQTATAMDVTLVHIIDDDSPFTHAKPQFDMPIKSLRAGDPLEVTLSINTISLQSRAFIRSILDCIISTGGGINTPESTWFTYGLKMICRIPALPYGLPQPTM